MRFSHIFFIIKNTISMQYLLIVIGIFVVLTILLFLPYRTKIKILLQTDPLRTIINISFAGVNIAEIIICFNGYDIDLFLNGKKTFSGKIYDIKINAPTNLYLLKAFDFKGLTTEVNADMMFLSKNNGLFYCSYGLVFALCYALKAANKKSAAAFWLTDGDNAVKIEADFVLHLYKIPALYLKNGVKNGRRVNAKQNQTNS